MKTCTKCGIEKLEPDFSKCAKNKCGLRANCKSCEREYRQANAEKIAEWMRIYYKANTEKISKYQREYKNVNSEKISDRMREYRKANSEKISEYKREWGKDNAEKISARRREYYISKAEKFAEYRLENSERRKEYNKANPEKKASYAANRRALKLSSGGTHSASDILAIFANQRGLCANCQIKLSKSGRQRYHVDHIMPLALGGSNWPSNLQCLCPPCNLSKGAKHPDEWAAQNGRLI